VHVPWRPHQQFGFDLRSDPPRKVDGRPIIYRHNHYATKHASEKNRHPLRAVFPPDDYAVTFYDSPRLEFAGESARQVPDISICERFRAVSAPLPASALA
jgi:hypothetical protein